MSRALKTLDFVYEHWLPAVPVQPAVPAPAVAAGRDLAARLRCLKMLMDEERGRMIPPQAIGLN